MQEVRVNWAFQKDQREDTTAHFHIFVGDLSSEVTDRMLLDAFHNCGGCSDARVMWDHSTGRSKGYGFVSFRCAPGLHTLPVVQLAEFWGGQIGRQLHDSHGYHTMSLLW